MALDRLGSPIDETFSMHAEYFYSVVYDAHRYLPLLNKNAPPVFPLDALYMVHTMYICTEYTVSQFIQCLESLYCLHAS